MRGALKTAPPDMDVCDLEGPWGPPHHHHIGSFACEKDGLDHKRKGSKDFVPMPDKTHAAQQLHALLPTRPDVGESRQWRGPMGEGDGEGWWGGGKGEARRWGRWAEGMGKGGVMIPLGV